MLIVSGVPTLIGANAAKHVVLVNSTELEQYKDKQRMVANLAQAALRNEDHVALPVSVQLEWQEMGRHVDLTVIWMDIQIRN